MSHCCLTIRGNLSYRYLQEKKIKVKEEYLARKEMILQKKIIEVNKQKEHLVVRSNIQIIHALLTGH